MDVCVNTGIGVDGLDGGMFWNVKRPHYPWSLKVILKDSWSASNCPLGNG